MRFAIPPRRLADVLIAMPIPRCARPLQHVALLALLGWFAGGTSAAADPWDPDGRIVNLPLAPGWLPITAEVVVPVWGWGDQWRMSTAADRQQLQGDDEVAWTAVVPAGAPAYRLAQVVRLADASGMELELRVTATIAAPPAIESPVLWLTLPVADWRGGPWQVGDARGLLPAELPDDHHLCTGPVTRVALSRPDHGTGVLVEPLDGPAHVTLQDERKFSGGTYGLLVAFHGDGAAPMPTWRLRVRLSATGAVAVSPVALRLGDPDRHALQAVGGNYCFALDHPTTTATRRLMPPDWARVEVDFSGLPEPAADEPLASWAGRAISELEQRTDHPLSKHLRLCAEFRQRGVPVQASLWKLPSWLIDGPVREYGNRIRDDRQDHLSAALVAWCQRAKVLGGEPSSFSFNEPDIGVQIKQTPAEHHRGILRHGAAFQAAGLITRLALGDVANPRVGNDFIQPTLDDPDARQFLDCLAVHSWTEQPGDAWPRWRALADRAHLPLVLAEVGPDPDAWRNARYQHAGYQIRELAHLVEVLRDARPDAVLRWEYTGDYDLRDQDRPTARWSAWRALWLTVPPGSRYRPIDPADSGRLAAVAFARTDGGTTVLLANRGWPRPVRITGLGDRPLRVLRISAAEPWRRDADAHPITGALDDTPPAESLSLFTSGDLPAGADDPVDLPRGR